MIKIQLVQISMGHAVHPDNQSFYDRFEQLCFDYNRKRQYNLNKSAKKVLKSIRSCPIPIENLEDAEGLDGVGGFLLDEFKKIFENREQISEGLPITAAHHKWIDRERKRANDLATALQGGEAEPDSKRVKADVVTTSSTLPAIKSGPWSLILSVYLFSSSSECTFVECQRL